MLKIIVLFFSIIAEVRLNICRTCQQAFECPMQRTMMAAVHATEERLIALRYLMQIFAYLAFSYTRSVLFTSQNTCRHIRNASQNESDLH